MTESSAGTMGGGHPLEERRKLLLTMLDAVYVDAKEEKEHRTDQAEAAFQAYL